MNIFLLIILIFLSFDFVLERILSYLNRKRWSPEIPEQAKGIFDPERYRKSQEYFLVNNRFSEITSTLGFIATLAILLSGGFGWLDTQLRTITENPYKLALLYFGVLGIAGDLASLPFSLYHTFVIEERFGFNKTTLRTFLLDKLKAYLLAVIIGGLLISLLIWIWLHTGSYFWVLAWITVSFFTLFATLFYASWILPLFNKLTPLPDGELRAAIETYANTVEFDLKNIFVMDGSKRSSKANAFFSGLGRKKKIVLFDTLIEKHTVPELVSVLAHEIGHYKLKHTRTGLLISLMQSGLLFYVLSLFLGNEHLALALGGTTSSFHLDIIAFGLLYSPLGDILGLIMNGVSRRNEFQADAFAKKTYDGTALSSALKKLSADSLSNMNPHPAYVFVHYSHPPLLQRLAALETEKRVKS